jgi:hypothetical protein
MITDHKNHTTLHCGMLQLTNKQDHKIKLQCGKIQKFETRKYGVIQ